MKKFTLIVLAVALFLVVGCANTPNSNNNNPGLITGGTILPLDPLEHDWQDISIDDGEVEKGFHFKNEGTEDLVLTGLVTSCMCTSAYIELPDGSISPEFGMHGNPDWTYNVAPGEEFEVEISFDPMAHGPKAVGLIQREVFLSSSASSEPLAITVSANVLFDEEYQEKYSDQDFQFSETEFDFGIVKQSGPIVSHEYSFKYTGETPVTVTGTPTSCACTTAEINKTEFKKGDTGILTVFFDPNLHEEPTGKFFKTATILTEPKLEKQPEVKIWAEMDLDLGPDAYKLKAEHKE